MALRGEVDPELTPFFWHWIMFPMLDLLGPELVYAVGIQALGYPPTWVDMKEEAAIVEAAIKKYLEQ